MYRRVRDCGARNGPGAIYECGCADIPGDCDRDGNQIDAIGECGGSCTADIDNDGICDEVGRMSVNTMNVEFVTDQVCQKALVTVAETLTTQLAFVACSCEV